MTIAEQLHARQEELRNRMAFGIAKGFSPDLEKAWADADIQKALNDDIEKGKWSVGDEKVYQGATWVVGGFNAKGTPLWRKKKDGAGGGASAAPAAKTEQPKAGAVTWDKADSFNKKGSDEAKLWNSWYKFQTSGDPSNMSAFRMTLEKKFPNVATWTQTSPNTGKAVITAKDSAGKEVASIDLSGDTIDLTKLQTFMDKCHKVQPVAQAKQTDGNGDTAAPIGKGVALKGTKSEKLKKYCSTMGHKLEKCTKPGFFMVTLKKDGASESKKLIDDLKEIGYGYVQDGKDSSGHFLIFSSTEKYAPKESKIDLSHIPDKEFKQITHMLEKVSASGADAPRHLEEEAMTDEELVNFAACADKFKNDVDHINKLTRENCAKWSKLAHDEIKYREGEKKKTAKKPKIAIDETTVDQAEYDRQKKMALQVNDSARNMAKQVIQGNLDKAKKELQETIEKRPGAMATIKRLQNNVTRFVSQKKALEDAVAEIKKNRETDTFGIKGEPKKGIIAKNDEEGTYLKYDPNTQTITFWEGKQKYDSMDCSGYSDWSKVEKDLKEDYGWDISKKESTTKQPAFVTKTIDKIRDVLKYRNISDEHLKKLASAMSKDEETAKKIIGVKFPVAGTVGPGISYSSDEKSNPINGGEEIICESSKSYVTTSRSSSPYTRTGYTMYLKDIHSGTKKTLSSSVSSTGRYGTTAAVAKQECILEGLLTYYKNSVYGS